MNHTALSSVTHSTAPVFLPLDVQALPLAHRHLIEASAGTGKTFNITRIAIKVLLVKKISITQLLIVTFTKAATQELRARIAQTLQEFIGMLEGEPNDWDPLLTHIISTDINISVENALRMLKVAVFEMDEAAIFTINSFCGRMLTQSSFLTHRPFDQAIIDDSESIYIEVIQDWFLQQQSHPPMRSALSDMGVETPTKYFETYKTILLSTLPVEYPTESSIAALSQRSGQLIFDALAPQRAAFAEELKPHVALIQAYFDAKKKDIIVHQVLDWCNDTEFSDITALLSVMLHGTAIKGYIKTLGVNDPDALIDIFKEFHNVVKKSFSTYNKRFTEMSENIAAIELIADSLVTIKALASNEKRRCGVLDHSDTVSLFSQQIVDGNAQLISSIQAQFPIALIDEFQDTDADQYAIFQHVYPNDDPSLMLLMIGDPKQAIYGFRGGDVFTYLKAVNDANYHWSMDTNYRSTESVVNGYNTLFYGLSVPQYRIRDLQLWAQQQATISHDDAIGILPTPEQGLFDYGIQYNWILATAKAKANNTPLHDPLSQSGTHFFALRADSIDIQHPVAQDKFTAIKLMSQWVAQEVQRLLTSASLGDKLVAPADIAILVNNRSQGQIIKKIFAHCGLNSVILSDRTSIFASDQATNLYRFLNGILNFNQDRAFKAMLGTDLMGLERETLYEIENDLNTIDQYKLIAHDLLQRWQRDGVMAMLIYVLKNNFTIYGQSDEVERVISNYMQLAEILNEVERTQSLVTMTVTFLYEKLAQKNAADSYCQRLESDDALIKIVTIHGSKGLEYPIVFVPFDSFGKEKIISDSNKFCTYYDIEAQEKRHFLGRVPHIEAQQTEQLSREAIRLLYVAITRAAHRCYLGYQDIHHYSNSAIHYILSEVVSEQQLSAHAYMNTLAKHEPDVFAYHAVPDSISLDKMKSTSTKPVLAALGYAGKTQSQWQVFSYSKLLKHNVQIDLNEKSHADDTAIFSPNAQVTDNESAAIRFTLTKGAGAGNLLHNILEKSDFTQPFENELVNQEFKEYLAADIEHAPAVIDWLNEVVRTPLINPFSDSTFTLHQITMRQTLREPQFYFPLTDTSIESLTQLLKFHRGMHVSIASLQRKLQGMMQGFIDLIFEVDGKYYVSDYKSTHLGNSFASYSHDALLHDIQSHHYDLQYLIYIWVLHNLLSQRIADYDPQIHLGGVYYLYLRGMSPQAPTHSGVYYREITQQDISALHNTFATSTNKEGKPS